MLNIVVVLQVLLFISHFLLRELQRRQSMGQKKMEIIVLSSQLKCYGVVLGLQILFYTSEFSL